MNVRATLVLLALTVVLGGCSNTPESQERVREDTARTTAALKSDVKGVAEGIRDGLKTPAASSNDAAAGPKVDINTASLAQLETLPGLDAETARHIIRHRPYRAPEDLRKEGIVPFTVYDHIAPRLTASRRD